MSVQIAILGFWAAGLVAGVMSGQEQEPGAAPLTRQLLGPEHPNEIHVDQNCRIYEIAPHSNGEKEHIYTDRGICDAGDVHVSNREETNIDDGKRKRTYVTIREHTFTLHNPTTERVTFVVEQGVRKGWQIDSDPPPTKIDGATATFLIYVDAGQTLSLHVGERHPPR